MAPFFVAYGWLLFGTIHESYFRILEACGLPPKPQQHIDGKSILGVFKNQKLERNLFWHYPHWGNQGGSPGSVIRKGNWKYIQYYTGKRKACDVAVTPRTP